MLVTGVVASQHNPAPPCARNMSRFATSYWKVAGEEATSKHPVWRHKRVLYTRMSTIDGRRPINRCHPISDGPDKCRSRELNFDEISISRLGQVMCIVG